MAFVNFAVRDTWNRANAPLKGTAYPNMHSAVEGSPRARWNVENYPEICALLEHAASLDREDDPPWLRVSEQARTRLHTHICSRLPRPHFRPTSDDPAGAAWIAAGENRTSANGSQPAEMAPHPATWPWTCCINHW